jgi:hypothetical protein
MSVMGIYHQLSAYNAFDILIPRVLIRMRFWWLLTALVSVALASASDASNSVKPVEFYLDGKFECSVRGNPEGNNEYCDGESLLGQHTVSTKGEGLDDESCKFFIGRLGGAYVNFTKAGHLNCFSFSAPH